MKLKHLKLYFFKNHSNFELTTNADVVGIYGLNGAGKTNVLDAIHTLCLAKSYFSATDIQCINNDEEMSSVYGVFSVPQDHEVRIKLQRSKRKIIERNDKKIGKIVDYLGNYFAVVIAPGDISLIYGGNADRRRFIDQIISQVDREYLQSLLRYNKLIDQRNRVLKNEMVDKLVLESLDQQITPLIATLYNRRSQFLKEFIPLFSKFYHLISKESEQVDIQYISQFENQKYSELIEQNFPKDKVLKRSTVGIHKDEIEISLNELQLRKYGSQGQIKSCLIAMKLAEYQYYQEKKDVLPLLLLDDIFEKIDDERAQALTDIIKNGTFGQLFISDTQEARLQRFCDAINSNNQLIGV